MEKPQDIFLHGVELLRGGQNAAAIQTLLAAIQADAMHFDAHLALGAGLMQSGRFADASGIFERAVALRPDAATAYRDLGAAYDCQSLHDQAIEAYQKAAQIAPRLSDVQHRLSELYVLHGRKQEASDCLDRAADVKPKTTNARLYRSDARILRGDMAGAEQWARKAVALEPASDAAHGTLAGVLYAQGRFAEAETSFERALRLNPKSAKAWDGLAHCRKYTASDSAIPGRMQAVLQRNDLTDSERMTIQFALGKVRDDGGDYAGAMAQFDAGNAIRAKTTGFDRAGFAALIDWNIEHFTQDFIGRNASSGAPDETPLFIVGMYRSGTTLVEQIVSSHPDIAAGGELTVWSPLDIQIDPATGTFDPVRATGAIGRYLSLLRRIGPSAARVTDKLPFNFLRLGAIHALLPNARIIHCQRDPIDTCLSIYTTLFNTGVNFAARKDDLAFCYRQYLRMMEHWRKVLPPDVLLDVQYERLIADRDAETRRLIAFTGLDWDENCLAPERNQRPISTSSAWQARQPVYANSVQRWRRYEPWIGDLRDLISPWLQPAS